MEVKKSGYQKHVKGHLQWKRSCIGYSMSHKILVVDDQADIRNLLKDAFSRQSYNVLCSSSAKDALSILDKKHVDVVISDEIMPGMSGTEFLAIVRKKYPDTIRIILTGHASLESAICAINEGEVYRFFVKPCNMVDLSTTIRHAIQHQELLKENKRLIEIINQYVN